MSRFALTLALLSKKLFAGTVVLNWLYTGDIAKINQFKVYMSEDGGKNYTRVVSVPGNPPPLTTTLSDLNDNKFYTFMMTAATADEESDFSNVMTTVAKPAPKPQPSMGGLNMSQGTLSVLGTKGDVYVVEVSTDLKSWTPLPQITAPADRFDITLPKAYLKMKQAFFRLKKISGTTSTVPVMKWTEGLAVDSPNKPTFPPIDIKPSEPFQEEPQIDQKRATHSDLS